MKSTRGVDLGHVQAVYGGPEGDLWELLMGEQIHIGGLRSSQALAERAGIGPGQRGVDLCCCNGAGMRFLVRLRGVASMIGVDATPKVVERGRRRCEEQGLADRIRFVLGDATATGLPDAEADFVWGEDAWCYVVDKEKLVAEAARLVRPGGTIAFTDWIEGPTGLGAAEAERFLQFMKFATVEDLAGYRRLLEGQGCEVLACEDTGWAASYFDLYAEMAEKQLTYDVMTILGFDGTLLAAVGGEMAFMKGLAHQGKITQGRFVARRT